MIEKRELFRKGLTKESMFNEYKLEDLLMIGEFIGRNVVFFKDLYKGYMTKKELAEFKSSKGAKVIATFDWASETVKINRGSIEFDFTIDLFLIFMNLIDTCFLEIIPLASIVDLDWDFMDKNVRETMTKSNMGALVVISGRKISLERGMNNIVVDYIGRLWPFGETEYMPPILLSNVMIKSIVHKGLVNDVEKEVVNRYRLDLIDKKQRSTMFISDSELDVIRTRAVAANQLNDEIKREGESNG